MYNALKVSQAKKSQIMCHALIMKHFLTLCDAITKKNKRLKEIFYSVQRKNFVCTKKKKKKQLF